MSRVGRQPLKTPKGVSVRVANGRVRVEGPKGSLERAMPRGITVVVEGDTVFVRRQDDGPASRGLHGLARVLLGNMVEGVTTGFRRVLEINGVGYRAEARGDEVFLTLGFSHPIAYRLPPGVSAKVERQVVVTIEGPDRELLGQVAAALRRLRPPEPYKGKGVKYAEEHIRRKAGKAAAGATR
jgi:large subunit ribosomal protein L6